MREIGIVVVADTGEAVEAVELARYYEPDVLVMDVTRSGRDGLGGARAILEERPAASVVLLTDSTTDSLGLEGLRAGAAGFLRSDVDPHSLARAIVGALNGEAAIPRSVAMRLIEQMRSASDAGHHLRPVRSPLTPRQWEVLDCVCEGMATHDIAAALDVTPDTVRSHIKDILHRLGVRSRREAVDAASRLRGLKA
jgi:DNA-binding NarL/FixJ family response regulator